MLGRDVVARGAGGQPRAGRARPRRSSTSLDRRGGRARGDPEQPRRGRQLRGLDRRGRRRGDLDEAMAVNADRRRHRRGGGRRDRTPGDLPLDRLRLRRHARATAYVESDETGPLGLRRGRSSRARRRPRPPTRATSSCARPGSSASTGATSSTRCSASPTPRTRSWSCATRSAARPTPATSRQALVSLARRRGLRDPPHGRRRALLVVRVRRRDLPPGQVECRVLSATSDMLDRPAPRPAFSVLVSEREHPILLPDWEEGLAGLSRRARRVQRMKVLVTGGAGFIGSNFVRYFLAAHPEDEHRRARQAHLRGPDASPSQDLDDRRADGLRRGRHRRPRRRALRPSRAATRS